MVAPTARRAVSSNPPATVSAASAPARVGRGVVVSISQAGLAAARERGAAPTMGRIRAAGGSGGVPQVEPRMLQLQGSDSLPRSGRLSGKDIVSKGIEATREPSLLSTLASGGIPLGQWNDTESYAALKQMRPGAEIERAAARIRSSDTLSARLSSQPSSTGGSVRDEPFAVG